uniref:Uncharacterized protein n=1 Tax=Oncorhynchus tshawytscha TaxID=74940 RepID=A0AAZ3S3D7_ONCTS
MLHRVQVTDTSQRQLFRGDCVNQAFMVKLLQRNHYSRTQALLVTLSVIYLEFKAHRILQRYAIPSGLYLIPLSFVFNRTMTQHTSRLCKGYLTKEEIDGVLYQMTWPPQSPELNSTEMVWDELDHREKEKQPTSTQHMWELLQDCWKSIPHEAG